MTGQKRRLYIGEMYLHRQYILKGCASHSYSGPDLHFYVSSDVTSMNLYRYIYGMHCMVPLALAKLSKKRQYTGTLGCTVRLQCTVYGTFRYVTVSWRESPG